MIRVTALTPAILLFLLFFGYTPGLIAQPKPPRLIVRGDDMGYAHSGNLALIESYKNGFQKSIEIIVPSPWFPEAVQLLRENPGVDIGVHLALTSEWDNIKWRPLTDCKSLTDSNGYFLPMVWPNKNYPGLAIRENNWLISDVEKEFRAQIETALRYFPKLSHLSAHMGCNNLSPEVAKLANELAREYGIPVAVDSDKFERVSYDGPSKTPAEKIASFKKMIDKLQAGKTYMFLDHPGFDNEELRAIHHIGYEDVATDRQGVTELFTSKEVLDYIRGKGVQLISYADLIP